MECPACGKQNREGARFCDSCGFELAPPEAVPATPADAAQVNGAPGAAAASDSAAPPDAPDSIGDRYEVRSFLGRGGRKDVYLARDAELDRDVAVALFDTAVAERGPDVRRHGRRLHPASAGIRHLRGRHGGLLRELLT